VRVCARESTDGFDGGGLVPHVRMCPRIIECVLLPKNVFSSAGEFVGGGPVPHVSRNGAPGMLVYRMCSLVTECVLLTQNVLSLMSA
jgi:hypothetical protein